jgi:oxalate decarboxylase/phosphoglucose isomerase-like protein (cupin superfamily)
MRWKRCILWGYVQNPSRKNLRFFTIFSKMFEYDQYRLASEHGKLCVHCNNSR